jgi:cyclase
MQRLRLIIALVLLLYAVSAGADPFRHVWQQIAPGVHVGIRDDSPRIPVMGNTTFVVSESGVVVFDGGGVPLMAERAIERIRAVTDLPVTHVIVSHWHQDHNWGIKAYADAFPNVQFIAHRYTRDALVARNPGDVDQVRNAVDRLLPSITEQLQRDQRPDGSPMPAGHRAWLQRFIADSPLIDTEYKRLVPADINLGFEQRMVIHSGSVVIELLHLGRGNTAGDVLMWLPAQRIVAAGDLVVRPTPYGFGSHPAEWAETLRRVKALDYEILIPGHGELQRDADYLDLLIETLESVAAQAAAMVEEGIDEEEAVNRLDLGELEPHFTGGDEFLAGRFSAWFRQPIARAAHRIARGEPPETAP